MGDLYIMTRCGDLHLLGGVMAWLCMLVFVVLQMIAITQHDTWSEKSGDVFDEKTKNKIRKFAKTFFVSSLVGLVLYLFVPSKTDAYMIYGLGSTIDYVKSNDKAKELPDKAIEALDCWLENVNANAK